ncbi:Interactor of constitutive active ROPs 4 [Camellia lanceoleosa]|uniref:Interactor of constitutive active ROPs 4 n=1 Tax=Camellia lanceoleosa TaxID=1840588 RepID=A0ACC0HGV7_9ERIC|nr:Interactor of constitutive active ROPs 4 [Camellia lanceoleosa]
MTSRLSQLELDLEESRANEVKLKEKLEAVEGAEEALETEMKKLSVHVSGGEAAIFAATLAKGMEMKGGRRILERCGSMDKQFGSEGEGIFGVRNDGRR